MSETEEEYENQYQKDEIWFDNYSWNGQTEKEEVYKHGQD